MTTETIEARATRLVANEVHLCVSFLVSTLAGADYPHGADDLGSLMDQALELAAPTDDWEEAATQAGWTQVAVDGGSFWWRRDHDGEGNDPDHSEALGFPCFTADTAEGAVSEVDGGDPYNREVFEHWAVSDWLARRLEAKGEKVDHDFAGMTVWARTTSGQMIAADAVIQAIARDLMS